MHGTLNSYENRAIICPLNETSISFPKNFVPPSVIDLVAPFDKGIPFCGHLEPMNK